MTISPTLVVVDPPSYPVMTPNPYTTAPPPPGLVPATPAPPAPTSSVAPVSYTHLTLPTIYSV